MSKSAKINRWELGRSIFTACPEKGARLMEWTYLLTRNQSRSILYWPKSVDWNSPEKIRGGNPILFPFAARPVRNGKLGFWSPDQENILTMPMHGFARQGHFCLTDLNAEGFSALLQPTQEDKVHFPYEYNFSVTYEFFETGLTVRFTLDNRDEKSIPWAPGHHFYFHTENPHHRQDYKVKIPKHQAFTMCDDKEQLISIAALPSPTTLQEPRLIDRIHCHLDSPTAYLKTPNNQPNIEIALENEQKKPPSWNTWVTWTLDGDSPYYCIEPWMAPPNAANHHLGLQWVAPKTTQEFIVMVNLTS